jgi:hypothetical protein
MKRSDEKGNEDLFRLVARLIQRHLKKIASRF